MTNFYVAASWEDRDIARQMAREIMLKFKWENTSVWWLHEDRDKKLMYAIEDVENIRRSDVIFLYNGDKCTAGKFFEIGMAVALKKPVFVYGKELTTVFGDLVKYKGEKFD
jgi:nucleoside 2-deoxyribosyltransferase